MISCDLIIQNPVSYTDMKIWTLSTATRLIVIENSILSATETDCIYQKHVKIWWLTPEMVMHTTVSNVYIFLWPVSFLCAYLHSMYIEPICERPLCSLCSPYIGIKTVAFGCLSICMKHEIATLGPLMSCFCSLQFVRPLLIT